MRWRKKKNRSYQIGKAKAINQATHLLWTTAFAYGFIQINAAKTKKLPRLRTVAFSFRVINTLDRFVFFCRVTDKKPSSFERIFVAMLGFVLIFSPVAFFRSLFWWRRFGRVVITLPVFDWGLTKSHLFGCDTINWHQWMQQRNINNNKQNSWAISSPVAIVHMSTLWFDTIHCLHRLTTVWNSLNRRFSSTDSRNYVSVLSLDLFEFEMFQLPFWNGFNCLLASVFCMLFFCNRIYESK